MPKIARGVNCFCQKRKKDTSLYCYGPYCEYQWVHMKCCGLKKPPTGRFFCSSKCKTDDEELKAEEIAEKLADADDYEYCLCKKDIGGDMVKCSKRDCESGGWFHLDCIDLEAVPLKSWYCQACETNVKRARSRTARGRTAPKKVKAKVKEEEWEIEEEHVVNLDGIPEPEISETDFERATKAETELRANLAEMETISRGTASQSRVRRQKPIYTAEHWFKVGRSRIHGRGMFAIKDIDANTCLMEYTGEIINQEEADRREAAYKEEKMLSIYFFALPSGLVVDSTRIGNNARFVNQSCNPNVVVKIRKINSQEKIFFYSKAAITKGEEITVDYKISKNKDYPRIKCTCGFSKCKKWLDR